MSKSSMCTTDVNITISVFNSRGFTAQDVLSNNVRVSGNCRGKNVLEVALGYVWRAKYPCSYGYGSGYRGLMGVDMGEYDDYEAALEMVSNGVFFENFNGGDLNLDVAEFALDSQEYPDMPFFTEDDPDRHRHLQSLRLRLAANPKLVDGYNIECDPTLGLPPSFTCQEFVATLKVRSYKKDVYPYEIRDDVLAAYAESERDGNLTKALDGIDTRHTFQAQRDASAVQKASSYTGGCGGGFFWLLLAVVAVPTVVCLIYLCRRGCARGTDKADKAGEMQETKTKSDSTSLEKGGPVETSEEQSVKTVSTDEWENESNESEKA